MRFARSALPLSALFAAIALARPATQPATPPAVGDAAKDFTLNDLKGTPVSLVDLRKNGPVVVVFLRGWVGYQCPLCTKQVGTLIACAKDLEAAHAKVVLIYPGTTAELDAKAKEFTAKMDLPPGLLFVADTGLATVNVWNLRWNKKGETAYPSTFVVAQDGKITFAKISHSHGDRAETVDVLKALAAK